MNSNLEKKWVLHEVATFLLGPTLLLAKCGQKSDFTIHHVQNQQSIIHKFLAIFALTSCCICATTFIRILSREHLSSFRSINVQVYPSTMNFDLLHFF